MANKRAFSLIEMIMAIVILGIVGLIGSEIYLGTAGLFIQARERKNCVQEARYALERMTREIREHIDNPGADITNFTATNFTFTDESANSISFTQSGSSLLRNSDVLASNVTNLAFTYQQANGSTAVTAAAVWRITISLTVQFGSTPITLRTIVFPRNIYNATIKYASFKEQ